MTICNKVLIGALSAAMLFGSALSVSAETITVPSITATQNIPTSAESSTAYDVFIMDAKDSKDVWTAELSGKATQADVDAIVAANKAGTTEQSVKDFSAELAKSSTKGASDVVKAVEGKKWLSTFFEMYPMMGAEARDVTFKVAGISGYTKDQVSFVHFNVEKGIWETVNILSIGSDDTIVAHFDTFSPGAIAVVVDKSAAPAASAATATTTATTAANTSPKTGVATNWMGFAVAAVAFAICAAAFSRKKRA